MKIFFVQFFCVFLPPLFNILCFCKVHTISVLYRAHLCMKCSLGISNFCALEEYKSERWAVTLYTLSSVQLLSHVRLFVTPWTAARQASLSITNSRSSLKLMSIELVMPSSHVTLCRPLLLLTPIPPSIRVFSNESTLCMSWSKYWNFSFSIIPSKELL